MEVMQSCLQFALAFSGLEVCAGRGRAEVVEKGEGGCTLEASIISVRHDTSTSEWI